MLTALENYEDGEKPLPIGVIVPVYSERSRSRKRFLPV